MEARKYAKRSLHDIFEVLRIGASAVLAIIRQKGQSQNGCFKKTKLIRFSKKRAFQTPLKRTHTFALLPTI